MPPDFTLNRRHFYVIMNAVRSTVPSCGTINFRYEPEDLSDELLNTLTDNISKEIIRSGFAYIVTTTLRGKKTLRMCIINANTTEDDIRKTVALLNEIAVKETEKLRNA